MIGASERHPPTPFEAGRPCLWMSAGLLSYRLCDRDFDCDHCPLDAALRGGERTEPAPPGVGVAGPSTATLTFPDDRSYGAGHTWVQPRAASGAGAAVARVGLDALAAALAGAVHRVRPRAAGGSLRAGLPLCELELDGGGLPVAAPVAGRLRAWNDGLAGDGAAVGASPYGDGWLADVALDEPAALRTLAAADEARDRARLDLRRFRRRAAFLLLTADTGEVGPTLPDGGEALTDLRLILGPRRYLELLRDLLGPC